MNGIGPHLYWKSEIFMHRITFWVSWSYYLDGSKLDERKLHEPYTWGRYGRVLAICFWKKSTRWDQTFFCPCINCLSDRRQTWWIGRHAEGDLLCDGIKKNYTTWIWHGEFADMQRGSQSEPFDIEIGDRLENMICDLGQKSF